LVIICGVALVVALAAFFGYKQLLFSTFDPEIATVYGVPTDWVETGFALALAATIVASMNVVGVTLIAAAIVIPPTTARLLTKSFGRLLILSTAIGAACGFFGMFLSYEYDVASGAAIVLLAAAVFAAVYAATTAKRALLTHRHVAQSQHAHLPHTSLKGFTPATAGTDDHLFD
jgi:ABC-type Mn2+/Zn2+ transport system permease subunit